MSLPSAIDGNTRVYGLLGRPVAHSLSPAMHNAAFQELGLNAVYAAFPVADLAQAVAGLRGLHIGGASVTIPFKEEIIPLLDEIDPVAVLIGAVNTVVNRDGRLSGHNTYWLGAVQALKSEIDIQGRHFLVLGAGGAARAIVFGLIREGGRVSLTDVDHIKATRLAGEFGAECLPPDALAGSLADVLINATPVGMAPEAGKIPLDPGLLSTFALVMDIVYRPLETRLLQEARSRGCRIIDGLKMLIHQGAAQFELWTGRPAPVDTITRAAYAALADEI